MTPAPSAPGAPQPTDAPPGAAPGVWYLAYTKPLQEHIADMNLCRQGYVTYLPRAKHYKPHRRRAVDATGFVMEPMFPRYLFFRPGSPRQGIGAARSTRGVSTLVSFGGTVAPVDDRLVESIRCAESQRATSDLQSLSPFQPGCQVRLRHQGLKSLSGLVLTVTNKHVVILTEILGRSQMVEVSHDMLEPA